MRKALMLLLAAALGVGMFVEAAALAAPSTTIEWWITPWRIRVPGMDPGQSPTGEEFAQYISDKFMELHPNVEVKYQMVTQSGRAEKATAAIFAGNAPDLYWEQDSPNAEWVQNGLLEPIESYLTPEDREDFIPFTLESGHVGDHYYMWPWNNSNNGMGVTMLLNPELFEARGVELPALPDRSWTIEEFLEKAQKLTYDENGDGTPDVYATVIAAQDDLNVLAWLHRFGAHLFNEEGTEFVLNSPEGVRALQLMVDMVYKYKIVPPGGEAMGVYDAIDLFHQHKVAMGYGGLYEIGRIDRYVKDGSLDEAFQVKIAQFPHDPQVGPVAYQVNGGFIVFRQPDKEKRDMVMEFARFITNKENMALLEDLLYITSRKSVNEQLAFDNVQAYTDVSEQVEVYTRALDYGVPYYGPPSVSLGKASDYLTAAVQAALSRDKTPQEALDDFVRQANREVFGR